MAEQQPRYASKTVGSLGSPPCSSSRRSVAQAGPTKIIPHPDQRMPYLPAGRKHSD